MTDTNKSIKVTGSGSSDVQVPADDRDTVPVPTPSSSNEGQDDKGSLEGPNPDTSKYIQTDAHIEMRDGQEVWIPGEETRRERTPEEMERVRESEERRRREMRERITPEKVVEWCKQLRTPPSPEVMAESIKYMQDQGVVSQESGSQKELIRTEESQKVSQTEELAQPSVPRFEVSEMIQAQEEILQKEPQPSTSRMSDGSDTASGRARKRALDTGMITVIKKEKSKTRKTMQMSQESVDEEEEIAARKRKVVGRTGPIELDSDDEDAPSSRMEVEDEMIEAETTKTSQSEAEGSRKLRSDKAEAVRKEKEKKKRIEKKEMEEIRKEEIKEEEKYERMTAPQLAEEILQYAVEIEEDRKRCSNLKGSISGNLKRNAQNIQDGVMALAAKAIATGDPLILKIQNKELIVRIKELEKEVERLKDRLRHSPSVDSPPRKRKIERLAASKEESRYIESSGQETKVGKEGWEITKSPERVDTPPPLPQRIPRKMRQDESEQSTDNVNIMINKEISMSKIRERTITRKIEELIEERRREREKRKGKGQEEEEEGEFKRPTGQAAKAKPRIIEDIQIVPPRMTRDSNRMTRDRAREEDMTRLMTRKEYTTSAPSADEEGWQRVRGGRRRGERPTYATAVARTAPAGGPDKAQPGGYRTEQRVVRRRPPVSAAVTITGISKDFSYADALRKAREKISLERIGIEEPRIRRAMNGGLLMEIRGEDGKKKADKLAEELRTVLEGEANITRPMKRGEVRMMGLDDSVTQEEIVCVLAGMGDCGIEEIRTGPIRPTRSGLGAVWAQLPLGAAIKAANEGKMRVGWSVVRVQLLNARPVQCFKCWGFGHFQFSCRSTVNRTGTCFRCGISGHAARNCAGQLSCLVCREAGVEYGHRMGGPICTMANNPGRGTQPQTKEQEGQERKEEEGFSEAGKER